MLSLTHSTRRARLTAWLGLFVMCVQLWASGLSDRHQIEAQVQTWLTGEICSASAGDRSHPSKPIHHGLTHQHCPVCSIAGAVPVLPGTQGVVLAAQATETLPSTAGIGITPRAPDLSHAPPRAPPFFS
ncbi:MAG TPA: DUF2946 domain-containing protein [Aquabacterium sp.]|nr:DUF2946 domain-containing protein [Aquabacterium sp.]